MQGRASASVKGCWPSQTRHSRERLHSPGMVSHGDRTQTRKSRMVVVVVSFITVDRCLVIREGHSRLVTI